MQIDELIALTSLMEKLSMKELEQKNRSKSCNSFIVKRTMILGEKRALMLRDD